MTDARPEPADRTPTSNPVLRRALAWGGVLAAVVLVVSGVLGFVRRRHRGAGERAHRHAHGGRCSWASPRRASSLANRFASSDVFVGVFFGIVLGGWLLKFIVFIVLVVVLRDAAVAEPDGAVPQPRRGRASRRSSSTSLVVAKSRMPVRERRRAAEGSRPTTEAPAANSSARRSLARVLTIPHGFRPASACAESVSDVRRRESRAPRPETGDSAAS